METKLCSWTGLSAECQTDVIMEMQGWEFWELEYALYELDEDGFILLEGREH